MGLRSKPFPHHQIVFKYTNCIPFVLRIQRSNIRSIAVFVVGFAHSAVYECYYLTRHTIRENSRGPGPGGFRWLLLDV